jgi:hypothetical protein
MEHITERVEVSLPAGTARERWRRDETIPDYMRTGEGDSFGWSDAPDFPSSGNVEFRSAGAGCTIAIELDVDPQAPGADQAGPHARGLLDRFRDTVSPEPVAGTPSGAHPASGDDAVEDMVDARGVEDVPHNR